MALERLHKVLAHAGIASRRACEQLIQAGQVTVNGKVITELGFKVDPTKQKIAYAGQLIRAPQLVTLVLNKPRKTVTTTKDEADRRTVMKYVEGLRERVYPVGRLDWESEGLLIMTNDGELANLLTHPRYGVPRTYHAIVAGPVSPEIVEKISRGVWLSEGKTGPARIYIKKRLRELTVLEITVREGMNREVRRIFARFGLKVKRLKRIKVGSLTLGTLGPGMTRFLAPKEVEALRASARKETGDAPQ